MTIQSCLSQSTAHGLMNIGNAQYRSGKLLWLFLTIAMLACFMLHALLLYKQILEENVLVSTQLNAVPFIQPDIVFCPERFFARDYINHPPADEYEFMLNVSKKIQIFDKLFRVRPRKPNHLIWNSLNSHELYKAFFHRKHELFLSVQCNLEDVNLDEIQVEMNLVHFACFRLKPASCPLTRTFDSLVVKFYMHLYGTNMTYSKLNVTIDDKTIDSHLFIKKEKNDEMEDGIHVYFVQPGETIHEGTPPITASVNTHTAIRLKSIKYIRSPTSKFKCRKDTVYSQIYNLLEENILLNRINITYHSVCREIVYQNLVFSFFKCVLKQFPIPVTLPPNFKFCANIFKPPFNYNYLGLWRSDHVIFNICESKVSCTSIQHTAKVNYNQWPGTSNLRQLFKKDILWKLKENAAKNLSSPGLEEAMLDFQRDPSNIKSWKRNLIKVRIFAGEFKSTIIEESQAYSYKNFFSDVGGIMGFYMGASLLTLCEFLRLMHCTLMKIVQTKRNDEEVEEHSMDEHT